MTRAIGAYRDLPRVESKRWRGTLAAITDIPIFVMQLSYHIAEMNAVDPPTSAQLILRFLSTLAEMTAGWGFAAAAWTDQIDNEVMYFGLGTFIGTTATEFSLDYADWKLEEKK